MFGSLFRKKHTNIHLLHIGKTGGTSLIRTFEDYQFKNYSFVIHPHEFSFKDVPLDDKVIFFLRNPNDRFVSGFFSRKRKGQPTYNVPYNEEEAFAFAAFESPNHLAEALSDQDEVLRGNAKRAMRGIRHVNTHFKDWLMDEAYISERKKNIFYIGFLEEFENSMQGLYKKLTGLKMEASSIRTHQNSINNDTHLSERAAANLEDWYAGDYQLYQFCKTLSKSVN